MHGWMEAKKINTTPQDNHARVRRQDQEEGVCPRLLRAPLFPRKSFPTHDEAVPRR